MSDATEPKTALVIGATRGIGAATAARFTADGYRVAGTHRGSGTVPDAPAALGRLDVLVVSAGITRDGFLLRASADDILDVFRTNAIGPILASKAALKPMMKQRSGSIVLLSSMSAKYGVTGQTTYTATKGAVEAFARSFAREYAGRGLRINVVAPGTTDTDMVAAMSEDDRAHMMADVPMGRLATPDEIADVIVHTAEATYMSAATVNVSGGA